MATRVPAVTRSGPPGPRPTTVTVPTRLAERAGRGRTAGRLDAGQLLVPARRPVPAAVAAADLHVGAGVAHRVQEERLEGPGALVLHGPLGRLRRLGVGEVAPRVHEDQVVAEP